MEVTGRLDALHNSLPLSASEPGPFTSANDGPVCSQGVLLNQQLTKRKGFYWTNVSFCKWTLLGSNNS